MTDNIALKVVHVSKQYHLFASKSDRVREALHPFRRTYHREFWALKDITFEIPKGSTVGILGLNGSGKSTLLQIISSVLQPTSGIVEVDGKAAAILDLGAGFNPDLTGRENVILNGTIMGLNREQILERMEAIQAFADIGEFFDQPMKTYSSGMFMRVAFSAAIYVDAEVLILDEVLAVGDAKFQEKCYRRFKDFQEAGKTILFVTHDRSAVPRYCNMGLLLHQGELVQMGRPGHIAELYGELLAFGRLRPTEATPPPPQDEAYLSMDKTVERAIARNTGQAADQAAEQAHAAVRAFFDAPATEDCCPQNPTYNRYEHRFGNGHAEIIDYMLVTGGIVNPTSFYSGAAIDIYFKVLFHQKIEAPIVGIIFKNTEGVIAYGVNTDWLKERIRPGVAFDVQAYRFTIQLNLCAGDWFIDLAVAESTTELCDNRGALVHIYLIEQQSYVGLARLETRFGEIIAPPVRTPAALGQSERSSSYRPR